MTTPRLIIRPFIMDDLDAIHPILNAAFGEQPLADRREWLTWTVMNATALARLHQPPYGDRAIVLQTTGRIIGAVGLVPSYGPFDKLPWFRARSAGPPTNHFTPQMGLFWALDVAQRGQGYATEAARALSDFMFRQHHLRQIVATTEYDNAASIAVMERLGMVIERNPDDGPPWFQVVGILENAVGA